MPDNITPLQRHANMAAIHSKDTRPEIIVRHFLWTNGFRYRLNHPRLPGKPDIVLKKYRTCIFVNGCFWHGHNISMNPSLPTVRSSACCKIPKSNTEFWERKIRRNKERDSEVQHKLSMMGWYSITVWECQLKPKQREHTLRSLAYTLNSIFLKSHSINTYSLPEEELMMVAEDIAP